VLDSLRRKILMSREKPVKLFLFWLVIACGASAQSVAAQSQLPDEPEANPGRPTVSTPATLTPVGYLQFETGMLGASDSGGFSYRYGLNEVMKLSVAPRLELLAGSEPWVHSVTNGRSANGPGDVLLGAQIVVLPGEGIKPTVAVSYFHRVYGGDAPDLDSGSATNSGVILASADVKGFHYDTNFLFNEAVDGADRRTQFGQTLSVAHHIAGNFSLSGEIWHFTQPFLHGNAVGNLWAVGYNATKTLVFDAGFNRGLTSTSTHWEAFAGFTYLLPKKLF
jgi:hypothetical protein